MIPSLAESIPRLLKHLQIRALNACITYENRDVSTIALCRLLFLWIMEKADKPVQIFMYIFLGRRQFRSIIIQDLKIPGLDNLWDFKSMG